MRDSIWLMIYLMLGLGHAGSAYAQHQIVSDNFSDGDLRSGTSWAGDLSDFATYADTSGNNWLQLHASGSGETVLYMSSYVAYGSWSFTVNLNFAPSSSNRILFQLLSDRPDITDGGTGYALVAGENGSSDVWRLFRYQNGEKDKEVLSGTTSIADGGISKVKITRKQNGDWILAVGNKMQEIPAIEAEGNDNTVVGSRYSGFVMQYTASRSDGFYLDDVSVSADPAGLMNYSIDSAGRLLLGFSLPVDPASVASRNIVLDENDHPEIAKTDSAGGIVLIFRSNITPGRHLLRIAGLKDVYGFDIPAAGQKIQWPYHAEKGDIVINEFMYDPPVSLPEYVEFYNTSQYNIFLAGWTISDASNRYLLPESAMIKPGHYLVLSPDTILLYDTFGSGNYLEMKNWPVLNNGGDQILLQNPSSETMDSLTYNPNWGEDGISLERKSVNVPAGFAWNWSPSQNPDGGTPGRENSLSKDEEGPRILSLKVSDSRHIKMAWSSDVQDTSVTNKVHYKLSDGIGIATVSSSKSSDYQLSLKTPLTASRKYRLSIHGVTDWYGNRMIPLDTTITFYRIVNPDSGQVFITEFMYDPPENLPEYVELYNQGPDAVDLKGWKLADSNNRPVTIADSEWILPPDHYVVLTANDFPDSKMDAGGMLLLHSRFPSLNNGEDQIKMYRSDGALMDSVSYNSDYGGKGVALERRSLTVPAWVSSNWGDSPAPEKGTPGHANNVGPDTTPPRITGWSVNHQGNRIDLITNEPVPSDADQEVRFSCQPSIPVSRVSFRQNDISLMLSKPFKPGRKYALHIENLVDFFGNSGDTTINIPFTPDRQPPRLLFCGYDEKMDSVTVLFDEKIAATTAVSMSVNGTAVRGYRIASVDSMKLVFPVTWKPSANTDDQLTINGFADRWNNRLKSVTQSVARPWHNQRLIINEIMYKPIADSHDHRPDQCEYVELYNDSGVSLDLRGDFLHTESDENGTFSRLRPVDSEQSWIASHGYAVFYADTNRIFRRSRLYQFFKPDSDKAHFYRIDALDLGFGNDHDAVFLNKGRIGIDSIFYSDSWQNPDLPDTRGRSLERIAIDGPSDGAGNWTSCAVEAGGTPGKRNSVFEQANAGQNGKSKVLTLSPDPFSPDADGFQDHLIISYHLNEPDYLIRIRIFDRFGRLIRILADGKPAGADGAVIWDGLRNNGTPDRIGFYIIYFEAYGSSKGAPLVLKKTAVLARRL